MLLNIALIGSIFALGFFLISGKHGNYGRYGRYLSSRELPVQYTKLLLHANDINQADGSALTNWYDRIGPYLFNQSNNDYKPLFDFNDGVKYVAFVGTDEHIILSDSDFLSPGTQDFSVDLYIENNGWTNKAGTFLSIYEDANNRITSYLNSVGGTLSLAIVTGGVQQQAVVTEASQFVANTKYAITFVFERNVENRIYRNGTLLNNGATDVVGEYDVNLSSSSFYICSNDGTGSYQDMDVYAIRISHSARTLDEHNQWHTAVKAIYGE